MPELYMPVICVSCVFLYVYIVYFSIVCVYCLPELENKDEVFSDVCRV